MKGMKWEKVLERENQRDELERTRVLEGRKHGKIILFLFLNLVYSIW